MTALSAPHWERMRPVLEADISYHAELLASGGARSLFSELHPGLRWSQGRSLMTDADDWPIGVPRSCSGQTVWCWCRACLTGRTGRSKCDQHPDHAAVPGAGRGDGVGVRRCDHGCGRRSKLLLGAARARLLDALRSPATTSALALRLGVTPSAVSQHLAVLHRGGLVDRERSGRRVLYQTSELGLALLDRALLRSVS